MGREIRRVSADWQHPKDVQGTDLQLYSQSFEEAVAEWKKGEALWKEGFFYSHRRGRRVSINKFLAKTYREFAGPCPKKSERKKYMPHWPEGEKTHFQMYQNTSEGSPVSPVVGSLEELYQWYLENCIRGLPTDSFDLWCDTFGY